MASSTLDTARAQVARARVALDDALITGADTGTARDALAVALTRLRTIEASAPRPDPPAEQDMTNEAEGLLERYRGALALALARHVPMPPSAPTLPLESALAILRGRAEDDATRAAIAAWQTKADTLRARLEETKAKRAALVARRMEGEHAESDAAELALLDLDQAGLRELVARHEQARPADPRAEQDARAALERELAGAEIHALLGYGKRLQDALLDLGDHLAQRARGTDERLRSDPRLGRVVARGLF